MLPYSDDTDIIDKEKTVLHTCIITRDVSCYHTVMTNIIDKEKTVLGHCA